MPRLWFGKYFAAGDAQVQSKNGAGLSVGVDASGDEELVSLGTAKGHVAGLAIANGVSTNDIPLGIEHLDLAHTIVSHIEIPLGV